jgi:glycine cleavage system H protein
VVIPEELKYTEEHEWVARVGANSVRIGITDYAQTQLGDVVFVTLPRVGQQVALGDSIGEVESTKSVSDIYSPVAGEVVAVNDSVVTQPEQVNTDPYGDGWMIELRLAKPAEFDALLDAAAYGKLTDQG